MDPISPGQMPKKKVDEGNVRNDDTKPDTKAKMQRMSVMTRLVEIPSMERVMFVQQMAKWLAHRNSNVESRKKDKKRTGLKTPGKAALVGAESAAMETSAAMDAKRDSKVTDETFGSSLILDPWSFDDSARSDKGDDPMKRLKDITTPITSVTMFAPNKRQRRPKRFQELRPVGEFLSKSKAEQLRQTVRRLMTPGLGILAVDDSNDQLGLQLRAINLENTETNRHRYHEVLVGGEPVDTNLKDCISGVLMREESIMQLGYPGKRLTRMVNERNILLGMRFDKGVKRLGACDREYVSTGLDSVNESLWRIKGKGVKFALYRCVFRISDYTPSRLAIVENSTILARFAVLCQKSGIVPIVAPEVLAEGNHGSEEARRVLREVLTTLVKTMNEHHVYMAEALFRVAACRPGICFKGERDLKSVAVDTAKTLNECLPPAIGGVLLARDENLCSSVAILNHIQNCHVKKAFFVSFCFSRVIQECVASLWAGQNKNLDKARAELIRRAQLCSLAAFGQLWEESHSMFISCESSYDGSLEKPQEKVLHITESSSAPLRS